VRLWSMEGAMGVKWTAGLKVDFEIDEEYRRIRPRFV
jgi:hypothetical protein